MYKLFLLLFILLYQLTLKININGAGNGERVRYFDPNTPFNISIRVHQPITIRMEGKDMNIEMREGNIIEGISIEGRSVGYATPVGDGLPFKITGGFGGTLEDISSFPINNKRPLRIWIDPDQREYDLNNDGNSDVFIGFRSRNAVSQGMIQFDSRESMDYASNALGFESIEYETVCIVTSDVPIGKYKFENIRLNVTNY